MELFLGWSGETSKALAKELHDWLPLVIQSVDTWMSEDIPKGQRWFEKVGERLLNTDLGLFCVTADNIKSPWMHFEAGAVSKHLDDAHVLAILFDVSPSQLTGPFAQFQATIFEQHDFLKLIDLICSKLNEIKNKHIPLIHKTFEKFWPEFELSIKNILSKSSGGYSSDALLAVWKEFLNDPVEIIYATDVRAARRITANTNESEFLAMLEIFEMLIRRRTDHTKIQYRSANERPSGGSDMTNVILIGGPHRNEKTKTLLSSLPEIKFVQTALSTEKSVVKESAIDIKGKRYAVKYGDDMLEDGNVVGRIIQKDIGLVVKLKRDHETTFLMCGCHAYGSHGAALALTRKEIVSELYDHIAQKSEQFEKGFIAIVEVGIDNGVVKTPQILGVEPL